MNYNYKEGKQRVEQILRLNSEIEEVAVIPKTKAEWESKNGIKSWVSAIVVNLRDSNKLINIEDEIQVAKTIKAYTSEIIEIFSGSELLFEKGVRGDTVYGLFNATSDEEANEVLSIAEWANTYMKMLNELLMQNGFHKVHAGIGVSISQDLIIRTMKDYEKIVVGRAFFDADHLSKLTSRFGQISVEQPIALTKAFYEKISGFKNNNGLYHKYYGIDVYVGDVINKEYYNWIGKVTKL
jgi:hypothetical protein